jgi:hypothetical protein
MMKKTDSTKIEREGISYERRLVFVSLLLSNILERFVDLEELSKMELYEFDCVVNEGV